MVTPGSEGVDYSSAGPAPSAIVAAEYVFVCRYLCPPAETSKLITLSEAQSLWAAGLELVLVFEQGTQNILGGAAQGKIDGQIAASEAAGLNWPTTRPIYASADFNISATQYGTAAAYLQAFQAATGRPQGIYGPRVFIDWCITDGCATYGWQCSSTYGVPGNESTTTLGHICQQLTAARVPGCDQDVALKTDIGAWNGVTNPPSTIGKDDEMLIISLAGVGQSLLHNGRLVVIYTTADSVALTAGGVGVWDVSQGQWNNLTAAYGDPVGT